VLKVEPEHLQKQQEDERGHPTEKPDSDRMALGPVFEPVHPHSYNLAQSKESENAYCQSSSFVMATWEG
jgi:hypothetical protein